jgi:pimeloyl-ACP methyl ester carboxylesterase
MRRIILSVVITLATATAHATPRLLAVEVTGKGPAVVLVPGLGCDATEWAGTLERYRKRYQLHVVTFAGFAGRPAAGEGPFISTAASELVAYIRERGLERPVIVGHSLGGVVAMSVAIAEPKLLGGFVVVDALPFLPAAGDAKTTVEKVRPRAEQIRTMLATTSAESWTAQNRAALASMITDPRDVERIAAPSSRSDPKVIAQAFYDVMTTDLRDRLGAVQVPALIFAAASGGASKEVQTVYEAQYAGLAGHTLTIAEKARHFVMLDDPTFFFAKLDAFLERVAR